MDQPCSPTGVNKAWDIGGVLAEQRESAGVAGVKRISEPVESMDSRGVSGMETSLNLRNCCREGEAEGVIVRPGARDRLFADPKIN
jgi:hypothetical protein